SSSAIGQARLHSSSQTVNSTTREIVRSSSTPGSRRARRQVTSRSCRRTRGEVAIVARLEVAQPALTAARLPRIAEGTGSSSAQVRGPEGVLVGGPHQWQHPHPLSVAGGDDGLRRGAGRRAHARHHQAQQAEHPPHRVDPDHQVEPVDQLAQPGHPDRVPLRASRDSGLVHAVTLSGSGAPEIERSWTIAHRRAPIPYDLPGRKGGPPRGGPVAAVRALRPRPSIPPSYAVESLVWHRRSTSSFGFHLLETPVIRLQSSEEYRALACPSSHSPISWAC